MKQAQFTPAHAQEIADEINDGLVTFTQQGRNAIDMVKYSGTIELEGQAGFVFQHDFDLYVVNVYKQKDESNQPDFTEPSQCVVGPDQYEIESTFETFESQVAHLHYAMKIAELNHF